MTKYSIYREREGWTVDVDYSQGRILAIRDVFSNVPAVMVIRKKTLSYVETSRKRFAVISF
jgi:hypothetical protein